MPAVRAGTGALCVALLLAAGCAEPPPPDDWVAASAIVRPSVHSVWASRRVLDGTRIAYQPVGSGFVIDVDSTGAGVLTNAHAVADSAGTPYPRLSVLVEKDTLTAVYLAEVAGLDTVRDLALLRIGDTTVTPVRWRPDRIPMGTPVATVGYGMPEGGIVDTADARITTRFTVVKRLSAGYSSLYRTLVEGESSSNVLEVDLPLFPGVSGAPTFIRDGRVIGVNVGTWRLPEGTTTYGHVIPPLVVRQFLDALEYPRPEGL